MASLITSVNPASSVNIVGPAYTPTGAANFALCTASAGDSKYVSAVAGSDVTSYENVNFVSFSLPAGSRIEKIIINLTQSATAVGDFFWAPYFGCITADGLSEGLVGDLGNPTPLTVDGAFHTVAMPAFDGLVRQDDGVTYPLESFPLSGTFIVAIKNHYLGAGTLRLDNIRVDIYYNTPPATGSITVTNGGTSSTPTIGWTYSDANTDPQEGYQVAIVPAGAMDASGYLAGDARFNPDTLANYKYGTGMAINTLEVLIPSNSYTPPRYYALEPGGSYIAYVRVYQQFFHGPFPSAWSMSAWWTLNSTPPATPTVAAAWDRNTGNGIPTPRSQVRLQLASTLSHGGVVQFKRSYGSVVDEVPYGVGTGIVDASGFTITATTNTFMALSSGNDLQTYMNANAHLQFAIKMRIAPTNWGLGLGTLPPTKQVLYHETTTGFANAWQFYIDTDGKLKVDYARAGGTSTLSSNISFAGFAGDQTYQSVWVRAQIDLSSAGAQSFFNFSYDGVNWANLGSSTTAPFVGSGAFAISTFGGLRTGASTSTNDFIGRIYEIEVWSDYQGAGNPPLRAGYLDHQTDVLGVSHSIYVPSSSTPTETLTVVGAAYDFVELEDYLAPYNAAITYSGRLTDTDGVGTAKTAWIAVAPITVSVTSGRWDLKVPSKPALDSTFDVDPTGLNRQIIKASSQYSPLGRDYQVTVSDGTKHRNGTLVLQLTSIAQYNALRAIYDADLPVAFQGTYGLYVQPVYLDLLDWTEEPTDNATLTLWKVSLKTAERDPMLV